MSPAIQSQIEATVIVIEAKHIGQSLLLLGQRNTDGRVIPHIYEVRVGPEETITNIETWCIRKSPVRAFPAGDRVKAVVGFTFAVSYTVARAEGSVCRLLVRQETMELVFPLRPGRSGAEQRLFAQANNWKCELYLLPGNKMGIVLTADVKVVLGRPAEIVLRPAPCGRSGGECSRPARPPAREAANGRAPAGESTGAGSLPAEILAAIAAAFRSAVGMPTGREWEAAAEQSAAGERRLGDMHSKFRERGVKVKPEEFRIFVRNNSVKKTEEVLKSYEQEMTLLREQNEKLHLLLKRKQQECSDLAEELQAVEQTRATARGEAKDPGPDKERGQDKSFLVQLRRLVGSR